MERHADLIARSLQSARCSLEVVGQSLDGQDIDLLKISSGGSTPTKHCWLIARQHPGETMAQWWMEGALEWLLDPTNAQSRALLERCTFFVVPNMNPDGSRRGHLRTYNAAGRNLNREWAEPAMDAAPEVFVVREAMAREGVDFFLDVHGDESLPYCFIAGVEGLSGWDRSSQAQLDFYKNRLADLNPDFQTAVGYPSKAPGEANLTMAGGHVGHHFGCLAMTLEMPFKDTIATPDPTVGWNGPRSKSLAHSCLVTVSDYFNSNVSQ